MSTLTTVLIIAAVVAALLAAGVLLRARTGTGSGTRSLKRRFGPEYDRTLERHGGDSEAAHRDLRERVERHGHIRPLPLEPAAREQYAAQWTTLQERFVDAPRQAVADAEQLLTRIAAARGFPDPDRRDEQLDALSVHHPHHVDGLRTIGRAARSESASTEQLREALVHARALFEDLAVAGPPAGADARKGPASGRGRGHLLKPKGSGV
ncbi:hypothetical protein M5362_32425 [Streptomyces sp. Je 1-79]|uniref:hypothetical protein n=1 Tax=Streptomyces sp. Je 1-79 TaxID=2943847 RepID=UPI0021A6DF6F|nr:hypothetical protein [Streptomyces sp. Je 1-79]MCT4357814.1 hypothetical protein [Streptomyces sp. Je 1-79]